MLCKFCGKEIKTEKYLRPEKEDGSCSECTQYCMKKCKKSSGAGMSWHKEPCINCKHNPYKTKYRWSGERWVKDD